MKKVTIVIALLSVFLLLPRSTLAQEEIVCEFDVIVQVDDWLSKLADKFYGDIFAFPAIAEATNAKVQVDDTYTVIDDVDLIEPGWKLCIIGVAQAEEILDFELDSAPVADAAPSNLTGSIKIGAAHALSGPLASQGQSIRSGIALAISEINQNNVLGEASLEIIWEDTAGSESTAVAAFEKLIDQDQVVAILGPTLSRTAFAANPAAQAAGVPVIGSSNVVPGVTDIGEYIFRTSMPEAVIINNTIRRTVQLYDLQRVVIIYDSENAFTRSNLELFQQTLGQEGLEIMEVIAFSTGNLDFLATQFGQVQPLNPDAIILNALPEDAANVIIQARRLGLNDDVLFIGGNSFNAPAFLEAGGEAVDGTISGTAWNVNNTSGSNRQFVNSYEEEYGRRPNHLAAQAYTAVWALASALRQANSTDPTEVRDALAALEFVESPLGLFSFDENRNPNHPPLVQVAENEAFVPLQ